MKSDEARSRSGSTASSRSFRSVSIRGAVCFSVLPVLVLFMTGTIGCRTGEVLTHRAPPASDTLFVEVTERLAVFDDAMSMDLSPSMRLYVADAGADVVRSFQLSSRPGDVTPRAAGSGRSEDTAIAVTPSGVFGGSGTEPGLFQEPHSVDASTALFVNIADAGNGRIQRFSTDGALVEVLSVPRHPDVDESINPRFRSDRPAIENPGTGARPTSVESTSSDDIIVLDSGSGQVLMTDVQRRTWIVPGDVQRRPIDPVDIETVGSRIVVADAARNRLFIYDRLGSLVEIVEVGGESPLTAIIPAPSGLAVLAGHDLLLPESNPGSASAAERSDRLSTTFSVYGQRPVLLRIVSPEPVRDVRVFDGRLLVLTNQSLFVVTGREVAR